VTRPPVRALLADDIHWHVPGRSAIAVMVECTAPLTVSPEAEKVSIQAYATSWARGLGLLQE
jgi:hypothetical protein